MSDNKQLVIAEWSKDKRNSIRVTLGEYCGSPVFNIRLYYMGASGELRPARQGIALGVRHLKPLSDALQDALQKLDS